MIKVITILLLLTGFNCCYGDVYDNKDQLQEYIDDLSLQDLEKINGYMRNNSVLSRLIIKELLFEQDFLLEPVNVIIPILAVGAGLALAFGCCGVSILYEYYRFGDCSLCGEENPYEYV